MRDSFLDDRNFPLVFMGSLIGMPLVATLITACSEPSTPEEKAVSDERHAAWIKEDMVTLSPRPGVECYVVRGSSSSSPRTMSCVTLPVETK
jgi:hypothetical protein